MYHFKTEREYIIIGTEVHQKITFKKKKHFNRVGSSSKCYLNKCKLLSQLRHIFLTFNYLSVLHHMK